MNKEQNQDQENIQLLPAKNQDVMMLTAFSKWAFETNVQVGAPTLAGPPGYKSNQFYSQMNRAKYLYSFFNSVIHFKRCFFVIIFSFCIISYILSFNIAIFA